MISCRYDKTRAAIRLEQIIMELDKSAARKHGGKVSSIIRDCFGVLNELDRIENKRVFEMMWKAWYAEMVKRVNECVLPTSIRNHLMSTVKASLRNKRRDYLISHPDTKKSVKKKLIATVKKHSQEFERFRTKEGF